MLFGEKEMKNADMNEQATEVFRGRIDVDEFLRVDKSFRIVCTAYSIMLESLVALTSQPTEQQKRMILNMQADLRHKAGQMMKLSPSLKRKAEAHLEALDAEVK